MTLNNSGTNGANVLKITSSSVGTTDIVDIQNGAFVVEGNGNIGIGTTSPTSAKLVVSGQSGSANISYGYLNSGGGTGTSSGTSAYSIYATNRIAAQEFRAHSDIRIKDIKGISHGDKDLNTLMQIEITDYTLRDTVDKGTTPQKKVIAQQVAAVYPQAVTTDLTEVVPDIYQRAEVKEGWIMLATDLKMGERVKIITEEKAEVYHVVEVEQNRFKVAMESPSLLSGQVFVYGREVDDFHTVDYEALSMLNVSATQELVRQLGGQQRIIEQQQAEIDSQKSEIEALRAKVSNFETRFQALEALLQQESPFIKK
ncbi:MAG: tail fiber domain-containing protein [Bacteroidia bacterium]